MLLYIVTTDNFILFTVPGPPASVAVIDRVVTWQAPQSPNGILTGYIIRVYSDGNIEQAQIINVGVNPWYYQLTTSNLPDGNNLQVQVSDYKFGRNVCKLIDCIRFVGGH